MEICCFLCFVVFWLFRLPWLHVLLSPLLFYVVGGGFRLGCTSCCLLCGFTLSWLHVLGMGGGIGALAEMYGALALTDPDPRRQVQVCGSVAIWTQSFDQGLQFCFTMAANRGGHQQKRARRAAAVNPEPDVELEQASHNLWGSPLASGLVLRWAEGCLTLATKLVEIAVYTL